MNSFWVLLASVVACSALDIPSNPLAKGKEVAGNVFSAVLLTHLLPVQFLDKVPLQGQLEFYATFLNGTVTKGEKHKILEGWSEKWNVVNEINASNATYTEHMYAINDTLSELLSAQIPAIINKAFAVIADKSTTLEQDAKSLSSLGQQAALAAATSLTKAANLGGFNVAPGLLAYSLMKTSAAIAPFTPSDPFLLIDPIRLFDLKFLLRVWPTEALSFFRILTNKKITKAEMEKQIFAWAAKNKVTDQVKQSQTAYEQKLGQVKQLIDGFLNRLNNDQFPKIGDTYADQTIGVTETGAKLKEITGAISQDFSATYSKVAALLGFRPPFGPSVVNIPAISSLFDKIRG